MIMYHYITPETVPYQGGSDNIAECNFTRLLFDNQVNENFFTNVILMEIKIVCYVFICVIFLLLGISNVSELILVWISF